MKHLLKVLRSPAVRWGFLAVALVFIVWFVWNNWTEIADALAELSLVALALSALASVIYVLFTLEAWRSVVRDLGNPLGFRSSVPLFGISQLGKYIPGGVWNIAAAAELGRAHGIPRRHSVAAMSITLLVSIISGVAVGVIAFAVSPGPLFQQWGWVIWVAVPLLVLLVPAIMNRVISVAWKLAKLEPLDTSISTRGLTATIAWSVAAWITAGMAVAALAIGMGAPLTLLTIAQCIGGYALAWTAGFLFIVAPAGAGVREVVLAASLAGTVDPGAAVAIVLVSRVLLTAVDLSLAGVGVVDARILSRRGRD
ncbi:MULTISPECIES: lysylphosphatidylglycerol synthase domain-containing protein [Microbacterium]|uniref:Lysylphosphatidylglycerol synthase domain-containing protein n=1 Tax=Microbacterium marmarense TaxID=3122051 RepID=A0ABU8LZ04_9MICO